jgi:hypothetical protein
MSNHDQSFHETKSMRRKRDEVFANKRYSNMHWRFLRHKPPEIPHYPTSTQKFTNSSQGQQRKFLYPGEPPEVLISAQKVEHDIPLTRTTSQLFRMLELDQARNTQQIEPGIATRRFSPRRPPMDPNVMDYLTGEAQKKEMIDRLVSEMEELVASRPSTSQVEEREDSVDLEMFTLKRTESTISSILRDNLAQTIRSGINSPESMQTQSSDRESINLLPQRKMFSFEAEEDNENTVSTPGNSPIQHQQSESFGAEKTHENRRSSEIESIESIQNIRDRNPTQAQQIHWQKTGRVKLARDIPTILNQCSSQGSTSNDQLSRSLSSHQQHGTNSSTRILKVSSPRPPSPRNSKRSVFPNPAGAISAAQRFALSLLPNQPLHVVRSIPKKTKATYGAWYIPKEEWWQQHQFQRRYIERDVDGLNFNQNVLNGTVSLALTGRPTISQEFSTHKTSSNTRMHTKVGTDIDAIATRSALLHEEIPKSYIGKEYRTYILNKSMRLPPYLREKTS